MNKKMLTILLTAFVSSLAYGFTDSLWIVEAGGNPGDLVSVEVWLQYEGSGFGDCMSAFDIPFTYDATVCTVEAITIGPDFSLWEDQSRIDNQGTQGAPEVPKIGISAITTTANGSSPVSRGVHLVASVDFRILNTVASNSTRIYTLMKAFTGPTIYLAFVDRYGHTSYYPAF